MAQDDKKDKLATTSGAGGTANANALTTPNPNITKRPKMSRLHAASAAVEQQQINVGTFPNRICLMLDCSRSMASDAAGDSRTGIGPRSKIECLKDAVDSFLNACNFSDTGIAVETFGLSSEISQELSNSQTQLRLMSMGLSAQGGSPMADAMTRAISKHSMSRAIIVSDGQPAHVSLCYEIAAQFREADVPIDTVHIERNDSGADVLQKIAEITGGKFIKFDNIANFAKNFKFLAPQFRAMLAENNAAAALLGAREVK